MIMGQWVARVASNKISWHSSQGAAFSLFRVMLPRAQAHARNVEKGLVTLVQSKYIILCKRLHVLTKFTRQVAVSDS